MKLYHAAASPFVRKVMIVLHETGRIAEVEVVPVGGSAVDPGTMPLALAPLGKIPALERDEGPALYDSRVICRYLGEAAGLYPQGEALWQELTLEATADGIMDAAVLMVYEGRLRPEAVQYAPWVEGQWAKVTRALDALEDRWAAHLAGTYRIGAIAVTCALGYLDLRHPARDWRTGRPGLARWFERAGQRPSVQATLPA